MKLSYLILFTGLVTLSIILELSNPEPKVSKPMHQTILAPEPEPEPESLDVIASVTGTIYQPVTAQCDNSPLITADNSKICLTALNKRELRWVALSRNLLRRWGGSFNYGDTIYVHHPNDSIRGEWIIHDTMNRRYKNRIDFLVPVSSGFPHVSKHILIFNTKLYDKVHLHK